MLAGAEPKPGIILSTHQGVSRIWSRTVKGGTRFALQAFTEWAPLSLQGVFSPYGCTEGTSNQNFWQAGHSKTVSATGGALGDACLKEPAADKYKPNSIKNAIRYRFQIKAKCYRNLTVLEKASLFTSKYNSLLPYQGNPFSACSISPSQHNQANVTRRGRSRQKLPPANATKSARAAGRSGGDRNLPSSPAPRYSCHYYLNSDINAKRSVKRWAFIAKSLSSLR